MELEKVLQLHTRFRDWIYEHVQEDVNIENSLFGIIALKAFVVSFNSFKAIGLILPELYYESAAILVRSIWEHSLILHYMEALPDDRAHQYAEFTLVEFTRNLSDNQRTEFEGIIASRLAKYRLSTKKSRRRDSYMDTWSGESTYKIARELGGDWLTEYRTTFNLGSAYTHPSPGAILFSSTVDQTNASRSEKVERERTAIIAYEAIEHMRKTSALVWRHSKLKDGEVLTHIRSLVKNLMPNIKAGALL